MNLLHFLRWFKVNTSIPFQILLKEGGDLESEFEALAPTVVLGQRVADRDKLPNRIVSRFKLGESVSQARLNSCKIRMAENLGLIYSNTVANGPELKVLSSLGCPIITHVHELEYWIRYRTGADFELVKEYSHHYIAASQAVKDNLIQNHGIAESKVEVVHEFIPTQIDNLQMRSREAIRSELNFESDAFVVVASGTTDWRKGPDLFVQLASVTGKHLPDTKLYFLWVGGENEGPKIGELRHDAKHLQVEDQVKFLGARAIPLEYFAASDVFVSVSREDPYPLVNLEAASVNKPILCFENSGGAMEFVEEDCGFVVPYLDVAAMAEKLALLSKDKELRDQLGRNAARKVRERHDVAAAAPQIQAIVNRFL